MTASISDRQIEALNRIASALDRIATALHYGVVVVAQDARGAATSGLAPSGGTHGGSTRPEAPQDAPQEFDPRTLGERLRALLDERTDANRYAEHVHAPDDGHRDCIYVGRLREVLDGPVDDPEEVWTDERCEQHGTLHPCRHCAWEQDETKEAP